MSSHPAQGMFRWLRHHPYTCLLALIFVGMAFPVVLAKRVEWISVYATASRNLWEGKDIFQDSGYVYPPFAAWLFLPLALIPEMASRLLAYGMFAACLTYLVRQSWWLGGGKPLEGEGQGRDRREHLIFWLASAVALRFAFNALSHIQTDLLIAATLTAACTLLLRGKSIPAGILFGIGASFKASPLLFAPYLFYRRRWLAGSVMLITILGANLLPDTVSRPPQGTWLSQWVTRYMMRVVEKDRAPGAWDTDLYNNQSLAGGVNRLLATTWSIRDKEFVIDPRPGAPGPRTLKIVLLAVMALVALPAGVSMLRRPGRSGRSGTDDLVLELGMVMLLALLLSPVSSPAHFGLMMLPAMALARAAVIGKDRVSRIVLALAIAMSVLSFKLPGFPYSQKWMYWCGAVTISATALLWGCAWVRWRRVA